MVDVNLGVTTCFRCGSLMQCAAKTPEIKCWCVGMPALQNIQFDKGCYCSECYQEILKEQESVDTDL